MKKKFHTANSRLLGSEQELACPEDKTRGSTRYTSRVTRHTSHVTRHTSHVTRHTSHVTRHASRVTVGLLHNTMQTLQQHAEQHDSDSIRARLLLHVFIDAMCTVIRDCLNENTSVQKVRIAACMQLMFNRSYRC